MVLVLDRSSVEEVLTLDATIDVVEESMRNQTGSLVPERIQIKDHANGELFVMPGALDTEADMGLKVVNVFPDNDQHGLPPTLASMSIYDGETGELQALLDGTRITNFRTGAIGAVAARHLCVSDATTVGIFGSSTQARYQARAIDMELDLDRIKLYSRSDMKYEAVEALQPQTTATVQAVDSPAAVCRSSEIVVTATTAPEPVFDHGDLEPGTLVISVGSNDESMREIPGETMGKATGLYVDNYEDCLSTGDIAGAIAEDEIAETDVEPITNLLSREPPYRTAPESIYVVKSVGTIVYDIGVSQYVLEQAEKKDLGEQLSLQK